MKQNVGNLISGSYAFYKSNLYIWKFSVHILLRPNLKDFEHYFGSMRNECKGMVIRHSLALSFGTEMKTDLFQFCGHCWVFQICWHIECSNLTASSLRLCNSSAGIPSSSLTLLLVILPKAHLTSHSMIWSIAAEQMLQQLLKFLFWINVSVHISS